ncbi:MAG: 50S ribosomal protein L5 [Planctomycetota bacterium]
MAKKTDAGRASISFKAQPKKKLTGPPSEPIPAPRLKKHYNEVVVPKLKEQFGYTSTMQVPRITKIVLSMGVGDAHENPRKLNTFLDEIEMVTGQRPQVTRARMSVANFKLREGMAVGLRVTLRKARMYEFLDRLLSLVIPRLRDFRGLSPKSFDRRGNYNFGLPDQLAFPELRADTVDFQNGMNLAVATTARTDDEARELLRLMGFPFKNHPVQLIAAEG